jgi:hypothetical protein
MFWELLIVLSLVLNLFTILKPPPASELKSPPAPSLKPPAAFKSKPRHAFGSKTPAVPGSIASRISKSRSSLAPSSKSPSAFSSRSSRVPSSKPPPANSPETPPVQTFKTDSGLKQFSTNNLQFSPALYLDLSLSATEIVRAKTVREAQLLDIAESRRLGIRGSPINHIPAELHIIIANFLEGVDLLSYAYCSKRTAFLNDNRQPPRATKGAFAARLRRDRDRRTLTFKGLGDGTYNWCGPHRVFHHNSLFSPQQLQPNISEDTRVCLATKGRFRVCEHRSFNARELRCEIPFSRTEKRLLCDRHENVEAGIQGSIFSKDANGDYRTAVCNAQHVTVETPFFFAITEEQVQASFSQLDIHICPHLRTTAESICKRLFELRRSGPKRRPAGVFADIREACAVRSACETCGASFTLSRLEGGSHLLLNVSRAIRNLLDFELHDRDNIDLLVNLEDCGQVCYGFVGTSRCFPAYHRRLAEEENGLRNVSGS